MKLKTPKGIWALRGVTIVIALTLILVIGSIAYSAYEEVVTVRSELAGGSAQAPVTVTQQGSGEVLSVNLTIPNKGLYNLNVTVTCDYPSSNVVCQKASVSIAPGQEGSLKFKIAIVDLAAFSSSTNHRINGTVRAEMQPFVALSVSTDFGGFVSTGGA